MKKTKKMKQKKIFLLTTLVLAVLAALLTLTSGFVRAEQWQEVSPEITEMEVLVNDITVWHGICTQIETNETNETDAVPFLSWNCSTEQLAIPALERGKEANIKVIFTAANDLEKVKVRATIASEDIEAKTESFDVFAGRTYTKELSLEIPKTTEEGTYTLYVALEGKKELDGVSKANIELEIQRLTYSIEIIDVEVYSYGTAIEAGSKMYVDVVVKNRGNYEAEDVYVNVNVKELGLSRTIYLGDLAAKDDEDEEDTKRITVTFNIPESVEEGNYVLEVKAYNARIEVTKKVSFFVKGIEEAPVVTTELVIEPDSLEKEVEKGKGTAYTFTLINKGNKPLEVSVSIKGIEGWATAEITPESFVLEPSEKETVSIYINVDENAVTGKHIFTASFSYDTEVKEYSLTANVKEPEIGFVKPDIKTTLMIVAIVLAVIIIVLLVVLLAQKPKKEEYY